MHSVKKYSAFLLLLITCYSCGPGMDDKEKRNENWIWFIDKATGKGSWVPFGNEMTVPDGSYTTFYASGKIREKGKIVAKQNVDTIYYYDINETLIKYTVLGDSSFSYYVHDGPYKAYTAKGELDVEGEVRKHRIRVDKWYGSFNHFLDMVNVIKPAKTSFTALSKTMMLVISNAFETNNPKVPPSQLHEIDSLYTIALPLAIRAEDNAKKMEDFNEMPQLKIATVNVMTQHRELIQQQFAVVITYMKKGIDAANFEKVKSILRSADGSREQQFAKTLEEFQEKYPITDEQNDFIRERYNGVLSESGNE